MTIEFDPGYVDSKTGALVAQYPGADVYPEADFRVEWGPIFHRGRLDGSAAVLVIGQDPATNEAFVRRILSGVAGQRVQGFLAKLGVTRSYVMINAFLYSVYGQASGEKHRSNQQIAAYRNQWFDALLVGKSVQAVVALGSLAHSAWESYRLTPTGKAVDVAYRRIRHPTYPESSSGGNAAKRKKATEAMLAEWNLGLAELRGAVTRPDENVPLIPYGDAFTPAELVDIPARDLPAGMPGWMRTHDGWSSRQGASAAAKRRTLVAVVPTSVLPQPPPMPHAPGRPVAHGLPQPVDPSPSERLALRGRVVTMNTTQQILDDAVIYVEGGVIVAIRAPGDAPPAGFSEVPRLDTRGTIFPGLIELHNHLPYNVLRLWQVPKLYTDRNIWRGSPEYRAGVIAPMSVLQKQTALAPSIVRYVECKALFGGVTTSQGVTLTGSGIQSHFRGLVRNVERTDEAALPEVATNVADIGANDLAEFLKKIAGAEKRGGCVLHHLCEGTDRRSRGHFTALQGPDGKWALSPAVAGIHSLALNGGDLDVMAAHGASIVWSPLSNLLLYGKTADVRGAIDRGIRVALGSDWSPSGSKNLLGEMKAARVASDQLGLGLTDRDLVEMVTTIPASILRWDRQLGSIEPGKKADLVVLAGKDGPAAAVYSRLVRALDADVVLVVINGVQRYGTTRLMKGTAEPSEAVTLGNLKRRVYLKHPAVGPLPAVSLAIARKQLTEAMHDLPALAKAQAIVPHGHRTAAPPLRIELDELMDVPRRMPDSKGPVKPLSELVTPLVPDPLTAGDDPDFLPAIGAQMNLTTAFKTALTAMYK